MSTTVSPMDLRTSAADAVTTQLRRELLDGSIVPGSRLLPKDIAQRFTVSIVPVREAFRRLEAENLIVTSPQRATYAADVGLEDISGVYEVRRILEVELARRAAEMASAKDREACQSALDTLLECTPPSEEFFRAHRAFHWRLLAPATSDVALKTLEKLWQSVDRYMALAGGNSSEFFDAEYVTDFHEDHATLAKAFIAGDCGKLQELLINHLDKNEDSLRRACEILVPDSSQTT
jgi:DNA-binding GntR family transcriptional regulator